MTGSTGDARTGSPAESPYLPPSLSGDSPSETRYPMAQEKKTTREAKKKPALSKKEKKAAKIAKRAG